MPFPIFSYDLIIIGNTATGRYAALKASLWEARVALVTQDISSSDEADSLYNFTLTQLTQIAQKWENIQGSYLSPIETYQEWAQEVIAIFQEESNLVKLEAQGVDVIEGKGEFCRLPKQAFIINEKKIQARAYLIATETTPILPNISDLSGVGYLTFSDLKIQNTLPNLPDNITIIGEDPKAISLAQNLASLNKQVTLAVANSHLLPAEDREISYWLQMQLEANGINLLTKSPLLEIQEFNGKKALRLGRHNFKTDEIIIFPATSPNIEGLNLEGIDVDYDGKGVILNKYLQTTNQKVYACGSIVGGYDFFNLAQHEVEIALKNALFLPLFQVNYHLIPYVIQSIPNLGRVGMSEAQAQRRYGQNFVIFKEYFKNNLVHISQGEPTGFLKLIIHKNGTILGGHCCSNHAQELVSVIALAMSQNLKIQQLGKINFPSPSTWDVMKGILQQWESYYYRTHPRLRELRKRYFFKRRP